jgi:peptidoglycan/LPS O-acetylase OafA/YrhL
LQWLQIYGWSGVDLFFLLSGFIFGTKYATGVAEGRVDGREFFIRRLSRLYPLHLLTLVAAGILAWATFIYFRTVLIYPWNDLYHLFLNVVFAQGTGLEYGFSFNGPSWTLSLEAECYAVFFFICKYAKRNRELIFVIMTVFGACLLKINPSAMPLLNQPLGRALTGFFFGCLVSTAFRSGAITWLRWVALALLTFGAVTALILGSLWSAIGATLYLTLDLVIFPCLLVCSLGFAPLRAVLSSPPLRYLGAISYSIYLLHVVVQMMIFFAFRYFEQPLPSMSLWFYASYAGSVTLLAAIVHRYFEMPLQSRIRSSLLTRQAIQGSLRDGQRVRMALDVSDGD